MNYQGGTLLHY